MSNEEVVDFIRPRIAEGQKKLSEIVEELLDHCIADGEGLIEANETWCYSSILRS